MKFSIFKTLRIKTISLIIHILEMFIYYPKFRKVVKKRVTDDLNLSSVILDIGGNRGQSIIFFSKLFPQKKIISFEPVPELFNQLKRFESKNVRILNYAVDLQSGEGVFFQSILEQTSTLVLPKESSDWGIKKGKILGAAPKDMYFPITVKKITVDEIMIQLDLVNIFLLKIDVEGAELQVLRGALNALRNRKILFIQLENHDDDLRENNSIEIIALLTSHGFTMIARVKHSFGNYYEEIFQLGGNSSGGKN
jgi:FkbM family methyltransferase